MLFRSAIPRQSIGTSPPDQSTQDPSAPDPSIRERPAAGLVAAAPSPVGSRTIGVVHGDGARGSTFDRAAAAFAGQAVDVVVFGHSHQPLWQQVQGRWYLNPGSPTQRRREPAYSFAWLSLAPAVGAEIVRFTDRS